MEVIKNVQDILDLPENYPLDFLRGEKSQEARIKSVIESLYNELIQGSDEYDKLLVEGFMNEQIWQQLDRVNVEMDGLVPTLARCVLHKGRLRYPVETVDPTRQENKDVLEDNDEVEDVEEQEHKPVRKKVTFQNEEPAEEKKDRFFSLSDMEKFVEMEENGEDNDDDDEVDMFQDIPSDESDTEQAKYDDFFGSPKEDSNQDDGYEESSGSEGEPSEPDDEPESLTPKFQSSFERRQENLDRRIRKLEDAALSEKPWVLKGEVDSSSRPVNSLLEEVVEFDMTQRPAPVITEEVTMKLEDIIIKRIRDETYDDVERKVKPIKTPNDLKKKIVLDQEKSKLSLAQIYENEFLKQKTKETNDVKTEEELSEEKKKIAAHMKKLFYQLDTLSNLHYTPKLGNTELKIITNTPAINMEEVAPIGMADANSLAPDEVAGKFKRDLIGKEEKTKTDKKREKRKKKALQAKKAKWNREKSGNGIKLTKANTLEKDESGKTVKSSTAFFNRLQDEVEKQIRKKRQPEKVDKPKFDTKRLKL
ncbi:U3 small nucleolar ribonucleoprotein protein MPP10 [Cimex lectularius]|uniref:U3 small nucleolar ribonucleoprotein protein MPP10 n=1 Tax=Cimex lectularius TaxID=79782 RepID=A0A8I6S712_CIMLE|nr:U3 small nucleolar ribonucleoprotein protein MPP10 [Cimex lectularius]